MSYRRPSDEELYALARTLAKVAHSGQERAGGDPYFGHVERVSEYCREHYGLTEATIALLHDVLEDTVVTRRTLIELFPHNIVHAVAMLTRSADETYEHFIERLVRFGGVAAMRVKLADIADNLRDLDSFPAPDYEIDARRQRYDRAERQIEKALYPPRCGEYRPAYQVQQ